MITRLLSPLVPGLLIVSIGFFLTDFLASLGYVHQIALRLLPYALGTVVLVLCYVFHRHQVFFGALTLLSAYALIQVGLQTKMEQPQAYVLYSLLSVLIPVHLALVSMFSEKGLVTPIGLIRLGAILSSFMLLGLMWGLGYLPELIDDLPTSAIEVVFEGRFLSNLAGVFYLAAFCIAVLYFIPSRGHSEASLVIAIASTLIMLIWFDQANISSIMISCALMTMAVAVMRSGSDMAYIDELTEIPGRRALQRKLSLIGKRYTLVMVDIDHFKKFNDTYGHDVGDQVLRLVASKLAKVNGGGSAFRYGGEEFTLLFPRKTAKAALPFCEEVRETIADYNIKLREQDRPDDDKKGRSQRRRASERQGVHVTISMGICENAPDFEDSKAVMKAADEALYESKRAGRNCVTLSHVPS